MAWKYCLHKLIKDWLGQHCCLSWPSYRKTKWDNQSSTVFTKLLLDLQGFLWSYWFYWVGGESSIKHRKYEGRWKYIQFTFVACFSLPMTVHPLLRVVGWDAEVKLPGLSLIKQSKPQCMRSVAPMWTTVKFSNAAMTGQTLSTLMWAYEYEIRSDLGH